MDKVSSEISINGSASSPITPNEKRALSEVVPNAKRSGGNYGSLAKSQLQPTFYICHKVEPDDTMQRLALKYGITIQEIKRVNKFWSDAELNLCENVYIPVNSSQLSTLQTSYPTLNIVQNLSPTLSQTRKSLANITTNDKTASYLRTSDSINGLSSTTSPSYQDYFSKIDQQIQSSKNSLQSLRPPNQYSKSQLTNGKHNDGSNDRMIVGNHGRDQTLRHVSNNHVFVDISTQKSREKHISAALQRIQRERDAFDEL